MDVVKEKIAQACGLLDELDIDLWLIFARESSLQADPAMALVAGDDVTWQSFFVYSRSGQSLALVGDLDQDRFTRPQRFSEVVTYTEGAREAINRILKRFDPRSIALNYSTDDCVSDGLTHGLFLLLRDYLEGTPYLQRLISGETLVSKLRSRKTASEVDRLGAAAVAADRVWQQAIGEIEPGFTEIEIARVIDSHVARLGGAVSFPTIVNAADKTASGHGRPAAFVLEPGDLLHVDFGVVMRGYCSDIQRLMYIRSPGELKPPEELRDAFDTVNEIITAAARACRPGIKGYEVDEIARAMLAERAYPEYQHALGHQLGRSVHDGGAILGPGWERYGRTPRIPLEPNNVLTLELEIMLPGIGCVGLEEDIVVTENGGRFLSPRQRELVVK